MVCQNNSEISCQNCRFKEGADKIPIVDLGSSITTVNRFKD